MRVFSFLFCILILPSTQSFGQHVFRLSLEESIARAVEKGLVASDVTAQYRSARNRGESSRRSLWTSMSLSLSAPNYSESLTQQFNPITGNFEYYQLQSKNYRQG